MIYPDKMKMKHFDLKKAVGLVSGFLNKILLSFVFVNFLSIVSLCNYVGGKAHDFHRSFLHYGNSHEHHKHFSLLSVR